MFVEELATRALCVRLPDVILFMIACVNCMLANVYALLKCLTSAS